VFEIGNKSVRINDQIQASEVRVIDERGNQLGIMSRDDALRAAEDVELDLVEISPSSEPPVAKIIDWGKYQYQKMKEQQRNKKGTKASEIKQMRLGLKISQNDLEIKLRKMREFLSRGDKVKILVIFRGREMTHQEVGRELMDKILALMKDTVVVEQSPQMAGRNLSIVVRSK
jgi:translation initiation factor IF-3